MIRARASSSCPSPPSMNANSHFLTRSGMPPRHELKLTAVEPIFLMRV